MGDLLGSPRVAPPFLFRFQSTNRLPVSFVFFVFGYFIQPRALRDKGWRMRTNGGFGWAPRNQGVDFGGRRMHVKTNERRYAFGCDHTSTNAPDPIRTPQLSVLGRE